MITPGKSRPSIHIPRWASRILLEITAVRVERWQDISDERVIAKEMVGVAFRPDHGFPTCAGYEPDYLSSSIRKNDRDPTSREP